MTTDPLILPKLTDLLTALQAHPDPRRAAGEWKQVLALLQKAGVPVDRASGVVGMRDVEGLAEMIAELQNPPSAEPTDVPDPETCRKALQAFRKRLALMVLDEESKLGRNPLTKGAKSSIAGIEPPSGWPESVWQELARQGYLRYIGHGFYELLKA